MYSESEHPWFAWSYVFALVIGGVLYAFCEWGIFEQGWRLEQMLPFVVMIFTIFAILLFLSVSARLVQYVLCVVHVRLFWARMR